MASIECQTGVSRRNQICVLFLLFGTASKRRHFGEVVDGVVVVRSQHRPWAKAQGARALGPLKLTIFQGPPRGICIMYIYTQTKEPSPRQFKFKGPQKIYPMKQAQISMADLQFLNQEFPFFILHLHNTIIHTRTNQKGFLFPFEKQSGDFSRKPRKTKMKKIAANSITEEKQWTHWTEWHIEGSSVKCYSFSQISS